MISCPSEPEKNPSCHRELRCTPQHQSGSCQQRFRDVKSICQADVEHKASIGNAMTPKRAALKRFDRRTLLDATDLDVRIWEILRVPCARSRQMRLGDPSPERQVICGAQTFARRTLSVSDLISAKLVNRMCEADSPQPVIHKVAMVIDCVFGVKV